MALPFLKTPLHDWHQSHGAKMAEFGGYLMPISYQGVLSEHHAVRNQCGLFDISHMGEIYIEGKRAPWVVDSLTSNQALSLQDGEAQYSLILNDEGFALDDILVYRLKAEKFLLCVNASNIQKDYQWLLSQMSHGCELKNQSQNTGMIALQGPLSKKVMQKLDFDLNQLKKFNITETKLAHIPLLLAKTGYTGEDGCEFFVANEHLVKLWETLLDAGKEFGLVPVGLGARDTLRLEMGYVLYGHELNDEINPLEAGLSWVIKLENQINFIGKEALVQKKEKGLSRKLVGLILQENGIPREGMKVFAGGQEIGEVRSGTMSPTLKQGIGTALVEKNKLPENGEIFVDIRGKFKKAKVVKPPFIKK